jgi:hypothetical protein
VLKCDPYPREYMFSAWLWLLKKYEMTLTKGVSILDIHNLNIFHGRLKLVLAFAWRMNVIYIADRNISWWYMKVLFGQATAKAIISAYLLCWHTFSPRIVYVFLVVDRIALKQIFFKHFGFLLLLIIPPVYHTCQGLYWDQWTKVLRIHFFI